MALFSASNLQKSFGTDVIFSGASFEIQEGDHIGLVGVNGSGKTTLFRVLTGDLPSDGGEIYQASSAVIGYMEQHVCRDLEKSAYSEVLTVFAPLLAMERELEEINHRLQAKAGNLDELIDRQALLTEQFEREGGLTCRARARSALLGLGFDDAQMAQPIGVLSGANLLLLDEPTNHLDIASVEWLEDFLRAYHGAFLVISHDRYFLDRITQRTFEMENGHLTTYKGNYTSFLAQKEVSRLAMQRKYDNTKREITRLEGVVAQQRQWNREKNIRTAESKLKVIERLESTLEKPEDSPEALRFDFSIRQRGGNDVLITDELGLAFGEKRLFSNVNLHIRRGERVFLIGPNGCGKTSFFKTILGIYQPTEGEIRFGAGIDVGYYDQIQANLNLDKTVIDEIWDAYPRMTQTEVRNALAVFLFRGEDVFKPVSALSGGERARVLLLRLMLSQDNFLLLDEPTNHLDITSCEALEDALQSYEGTLFIVSHDRYLINKIADKVYSFEEDGVSCTLGGYDAYLEAARARKPEAQTAVQTESSRAVEYRVRKEQQAALRKSKAALRRIETEIEETEALIASLEEQLGDPEIVSDYEAVARLSHELEEARAKSEEQLSRWTELSEQVEAQENE